ncbi:MAG: TMEM198/TM7SF3 family protein [Clostridium butyricum]|nr:TMEM198/TM7SF3 family protein [Clostridium butyricum]
MDLLQNLNNINRDITNLLQIKDLLRNISAFSALSIFVVSIVHCFYGYKLLKWWTSFIGFILFGLAGFGVYYNINGDLNNSIICGIVIGIIGALISFSIYKTGVIAIAFGAGFLAGYISLDDIRTAVILGIGCGILTAVFMKPVLIITIAVSSGVIAGKNLALILELGSDMGTVLSMLFAVLGLLFQWNTNVKKLRLVGDRNKKGRQNRASRARSRSVKSSITGVKDLFYKLKNKLSFDDEDDDEYDYYDETELIPVNNNNKSSEDKTIFMPRVDTKKEEEEVTKLLKKN